MDLLAVMEFSGVNFDDSGIIICRGGGENIDNSRGSSAAGSPIYALCPFNFLAMSFK